ncbi:hypothetical protein CERZMDRAFT_97270 [Cercospora zeae-maydis SCOH1-5]|uniref:Hydrophobin n=1 Tax=Cercospora zeae-maydis SCOH1-5 TaxID=717836 RepID=A0A6A6FHL8_9PEZI|nr:hypothetical protein CERZMDRAFT_97270 [Cercospora zeae-maydis SCOH1-5]
MSFSPNPTTLLLLLILLAFSLSTSSALAQSSSSVSSSSSSSNSNSNSCTLTSTYTPEVCCPDIPAETQYVIRDCNGCVVTTETIPLNCFAPCTASATVNSALTTTIVECDATVTLDPQPGGERVRRWFGGS